MFDTAVATASEWMGEPPSHVRLERLAEGTGVQIMHVGPESTAISMMALFTLSSRRRTTSSRWVSP